MDPFGCTVVTVDQVDGDTQAGHVEFDGRRWRVMSGSGARIPAGTKVLVTAVDGSTLTVWAVDDRWLR